MKLSEQWLREWVNPKLSRDKLIEKLNFSGLAIESCEAYENNENNKSDFVLEFELTPNRGDCLSILGVAREISALTQTKLNINITKNKKSKKTKNVSIPNIKILSPEACPVYSGCVVKNITPNKSTPQNIQQKLLKSGLKLIHPVVDIMNYVMLELGQPLHAFDLNKLSGAEIVVRYAHPKEEIILLDNQKIILNKNNKNILIISDSDKPIAMAGIMGSLNSAVDNNTTAIFIESAHFSPSHIAGDARIYGLHTDASHRFERGVDPELTVIALERAAELLSQVYNNLEISEIITKTHKNYLPKNPKIKLHPENITKLLGYEIPFKKSKEILKNLNMIVSGNTVTAPSYRFDINLEVDLIEEIARVYGYEQVPSLPEKQIIQPNSHSENNISIINIKNKLIHMGYQEIISYSFISEKLQQCISGKSQENINILANPLSAELAVMRDSLWGSLIETAKYNLYRQQDYIKIFEIASVFKHKTETAVLSAIIAGFAHPEQWGEKKREVDFFDLKNTLENLNKNFIYKPAQHPALNPAQTAEIFLNNQSVGFCGALHPELQKTFDLKVGVYLFEINLSAVTHKNIPKFKPITKFPAIRRDISLSLNKKIPTQELLDYIFKLADTSLVEANIFDVYKNNIALKLIFQLLDRTLIEQEVNTQMDKIIAGLTQKFDLSLRS